MSWVLGVLRLFVVVLCLGAPVQAQFALPSTPEAAAEIPDPSPNDVKEFLRLLGDPSVQEWLRKSTQDSTEVQAQSGVGLRDKFAQRMQQIGQRTKALGLAYEILPRVPQVLLRQWRTELSKSQKVRSLTYILTFLLIGFGWEWLYRQAFLYKMLRLEQTPIDAPMEKLRSALVRMMIVVGGLVIFAVGSLGAFNAFTWHPLVGEIVLSFLMMVIVFRAIVTLSKFIQAPYAPELRLVPYNTALARRFHGIVCVLATITGVAVTLSFVLVHFTENDMLARGARLVNLAQTVAMASVVVVAVVGCILYGAYSVRKLADTPVDEGNLRFWRGYGVGITLAFYGMWLIGAFGVMWAILVVGLLIPSVILMRAWIDHFFDQSRAARYELHQTEVQRVLDQFTQMEAEGTLQEGEPMPEQPEFFDPYSVTRPIVQRGARFVLLIGAVLVLAAFWSINIFELSADRSIPGRILEVLIDSLVALLVADLVWTWAKTVIDKRVADYVAPVDGQAPGPEARMITLLPLLRTILLVTLLVMVGLSVLTAAGVNIAPIIAGAGILGIAIGFGTQSLVRDIVAGIFFLIDDAFRLGEYIEIGELMGTVESISIRSMRIRHHRGKVHTVPYGELKSLTNHSRDWVIMKLEFRVPFDTDLQLVKKLIKKVGAELKANEFYGDSILSTLKSQGVRRMEEFNMVVGVKFMTKPGEQWLVRRDAYQKVRDIFDANGIRMAERNVKVEIEGGEHLTPEQRHAVAGAAQEATQRGLPPGPVPDEP